MPAADRFAFELAAIALLRVRRVSAYLELMADADEHGNLRPEVEGLGKAVEHAARMLDRLGMSPLARARLGVDLVRATSAIERHIEANYPAPAREADAVDDGEEEAP